MPLTPFQIPAGRRLEFWDITNANAGVCWVTNESYSLKMTASPSSSQQTRLSIGPGSVLPNKIIDYYDLVRYSNDSTITVVNMEPDYNVSLTDSTTFKSKATVASSYTLTRAFGLSVSDITGSGSVTRQIGVHIASLTKGSTANIDLLIGTATPTVTSDYSIYNENTDDSYFAGDVGIGDVAPVSKLHVHASSSYAKKQLTISDSSGGTRKPGLNLRVDSTNLWQLYADNTASNAFKLEYNETTTFLTMATTGATVLSTTAATYPFQISAAGTDAQLRLTRVTASTGDWTIGTTSNEFRLYDNVATAYRLILDSSGYLLLGGLTASVEGQVQIRQNSIGTTQSDAYGINLINATAAAAGVQQYSPPLHWTGYGWKTDATAASQSVEFRAYVQPVQGTSAPTGLWVLESSINAGAYSSCLSFSSTALTASRLLQTDGSKTIISVSNLANWVLGTSDQITSTDVGNGTVQLSIPSTPTFTGLILSGLTASKPVFTDGSKALTSSGTVPIANGGTNRTSFSTDQSIIIYDQFTNSFVGYSSGTFDGTNLTITGSSVITSDTVSCNILSDDSLIIRGSGTPYQVDIQTGTNSVIKINGNATPALGFFNTTPAARSTGWSVTNKTTDTTLDCNGTLDQVADVLGTLVDQLILHGIISA